MSVLRIRVSCLVLLVLLPSSLNASILIWADEDELSSVGGFPAIQKLDSSGAISNIHTLQESPYQLAIDAVRGKIYWSVGSLILRSNLDGSLIEEFQNATGDIFDLEIDPNTGTVYWSDNGDNGIWKVNFDGSDAVALVGSDNGVFVGQPVGFDLDTEAGFIYWADEDELVSAGGNFAIQRADLADGSNPVNLVSLLERPGALAIDPQRERIYWWGDSQMQRSDLSGSNLIDFVSDPGGFPALDLEVDPNTGSVYWSDRGPNSIRRVQLDGENIEFVVQNDNGVFVGQPVGFDLIPNGVEVVPEPSTIAIWTLFAVLGVFFGWLKKLKAYLDFGPRGEYLHLQHDHLL